jgi:hypothetical protein
VSFDRKKYQADYRRENQKTLWSKHGAKWGAKRAEKRRQLRIDTIQAYGGKCSCCGEAEPDFLSIDHVDGNGNAHRKTLKVRGGTHFYRWLEKNNWPSGYRVLCFNCNCARGFFGRCPHESKP